MCGGGGNVDAAMHSFWAVQIEEKTTPARESMGREPLMRALRSAAVSDTPVPQISE